MMQQQLMQDHTEDGHTQARPLQDPFFQTNAYSHLPQKQLA